ncbi:PREDICTED: mucin-13 [Chinchilla lanigera]|uniref:mucin-13 n=1 Tax=Chinchilla lanigera TaxID=34839 RepID=UPI00069644C1|nr:PREDICTED: mucin-13 [Chinchilla lanigera]
MTTNTTTGTTGPKKLCDANPCGAVASCVNLYDEYICLCTEGYYFSSDTCLRGKTFPGEITVEVTDTSDLQDETSLAYQSLWQYITTFEKNKAVGYEKVALTWFRTVSIHAVCVTCFLGMALCAAAAVARVERGGEVDEAAEQEREKPVLGIKDISSDQKPQPPPPRPGTSSLQAKSVRVSVRVVNIFEQNTTESETSISAQIDKEIENHKNISEYSPQNLCEYYGCEDVHQDNCSSTLNCRCRDGLQRPSPQSPFCLALQCSEDCRAENKKQCLKKSFGELECTCLPGYKKAEASNNCQKCPFGYSGMDCEDQFQLTLTIVGTILGVLVLSLGIVLVITMRSRNRKKNIEEQHLIENDFQSLRLQQTGFSNLGAEGSLFPEVKTKASLDHQFSNPYIGR